MAIDDYFGSVRPRPVIETRLSNYEKAALEKQATDPHWKPDPYAGLGNPRRAVLGGLGKANEMAPGSVVEISVAGVMRSVTLRSVEASRDGNGYFIAGQSSSGVVAGFITSINGVFILEDEQHRSTAKNSTKHPVIRKLEAGAKELFAKYGVAFPVASAKNSQGLAPMPHRSAYLGM